jgi:hypothetical protein
MGVRAVIQSALVGECGALGEGPKAEGRRRKARADVFEFDIGFIGQVPFRLNAVSTIVVSWHDLSGFDQPIKFLCAAYRVRRDVVFP